MANLEHARSSFITRFATFIVVAFVLVVPSMAQSKYGLSCYGDACAVVDQKAAARMASAESICSSGDSGFTYPKKDPPSKSTAQIYWEDIYAAQRIAVRDYRVVDDCAKADLIVKITLDTLLDNVSLSVSDGDSGEAVFIENRSIQDKRSDLIRAAQHFRDAVKTARLELQKQEERAEEAERERAERAKLEEKSRQCQIEFDSLKRMVLLYIDTSMPQQVVNEIADHNRNCSNTLSPEKIRQQKKADDDARATQEAAAKEKAIKEKRAAELEKIKIDALSAFKQKLASTPFVSPAEGWMHVAHLTIDTKYYIILPGKGLDNDCRLFWHGKYPVLDCLGTIGRNEYLPVQNTNGWYLLKSKWTGTGEYAGTVKDGGSTVCLRKAGCYRVLAEVRQEPTQLPEKFQVPAPGALTLTYSSDDVSFNYPQNWRAEERKNKDNTVASVNVAAPEAHLASWVTHGFFVGHIAKSSSESQTLDGAYDSFVGIQRQRGLAISSSRIIQVGTDQGKIATYTSPSVLGAGETGSIVVVKDKTEGYYWVMMFFPSNDDTDLYARVFDQVLKSFRFKK